MVVYRSPTEIIHPERLEFTHQRTGTLVHMNISCSRRAFQRTGSWTWRYETKRRRGKDDGDWWLSGLIEMLGWIIVRFGRRYVNYYLLPVVV